MDPTREGMPKVSVIMSVFNGEPYLSQAIESILSQTFDDFEFIIVDDGSTDSSPMILETFAKKHVRIRLLRNDSNSGLIASLNKAFQAAKGEYIARQDADDTSLPWRFERQVQFLDQHPEVGVLGTWMKNIEQNGEEKIWKTPISDSLIRWSLLLDPSIAHATVMIRRHILDGDRTYRPEMAHAEDYDLWSRLSERTRCANLPECHYARLKHQQMVSVRHSEEQQEKGHALRRRNIEKTLEAGVDDDLLHSLHSARQGGKLAGKLELERVANLICALFATFVEKNELDPQGKAEVANDAACLLSRIGIRHITEYPRESAGILWNAACLNRGVPLRGWLNAMLTEWTGLMDR
jgi:glycosyltransferase involved in cell wall biosynthesis